jgi:hypothetical protein
MGVVVLGGCKEDKDVRAESIVEVRWDFHEHTLVVLFVLKALWK